jgi:AAA domain
MIVLLNGPFGVGKSTVARLLRNAIPESVVYNPEWAGSIMMRLPKWTLKGSGTDDFQDINLWRKSAVAGVKLFSRLTAGPIIVPMTFSQREYLDEVIEGLSSFSLKINLFCLRASLPILSERLSDRRDPPHVQRWVTRRNVECVAAHMDPHFGEPVETEERSAVEVAEDIISRLHQTRSTP